MTEESAAIVRLNPLDSDNALRSSEEWTKTVNRWQALIRTGALPDRIKRPEQAIAICRHGDMYGWDEMRSLQSIYLVKGNPCLKTEAMVALVKQKLPRAQIEVLESTDKACRVRGRQSPAHPWNPAEFTIEMAKRAGLLSNPTWKAYPEIMLRWRALSQLCRFEFPDATNGAYTIEEAEDAEWSVSQGPQTVSNLPPSFDQRPALKPEDVTDAEPPDEGSIGEQVALGESPLTGPAEICDLCGGINNEHRGKCPHGTEVE